MLAECYHVIGLAAQAVEEKLLVLECREHMFEKIYETRGFKKLYDELNDEKLYALYKQIDFTEYWNT